MAVDSFRGSRPSPQSLTSRQPDATSARRRSSLSHPIGTSSLGPLSKRKHHTEPTDPPPRKRASQSRRLSQYQDVMCEAECPTPLSPTLPALPLPAHPSESKHLHPVKAMPGYLETNAQASGGSPPHQPAKAPMGSRRGRVLAPPTTNGPMVRASLIVKLALPPKLISRGHRERPKGGRASPDSTTGSGQSQLYAQSKRARNPAVCQRRSTLETPLAKDSPNGKGRRSKDRVDSPALRPMAEASPASSRSLKAHASSFTQSDGKAGDWDGTTTCDGLPRSRHTKDKSIKSTTRRSIEARVRPEDERPRSRSRRRSLTPPQSPRERSGSRHRPMKRDPAPTASRSKPRGSKGRDRPSPIVESANRARGNNSDDQRPTDQPSRARADVSPQSPHAESTGRRSTTRPELTTPSKASSLSRSSPVRLSIESYQQKRRRPHRDDEGSETREVATPSKPSTLRGPATASPHPDGSTARPAQPRNGDNPNRYMEWGTRYKRTGQANVQKRQSADRMVGVLQYFQSVLAYLKHFYDLDSSANLLSRVTHWKNFLTYAQSLSSIFRENRCLALAGLILHLEAVIQHRLGTLYQTLANNECSKTSDGHDSAALSSVVQLFQQQANVMRSAKRAWADGETLFSFDALADQFPHTWQLRGSPAPRAVTDREFDAYRQSMVLLVGTGTIPSSFTLYTPIPDIIRLLECVLFETAYSHSLDFQVYKSI
ncbi:hypothetical protein H4R34_001531 [Dimargaris verticillata]|uniref:Uncharacterized protein n=1 Tax=Dimargaris verticillata TaxID=2761393 RepID=A0A9W8BB68_9FUNG|nr:hypothetical protein H4R34_001531 [Dimargaris verticillata]